MCDDNNLLKKKFDDTINLNVTSDMPPLTGTNSVSTESLSNLATAIISEQQEKEKRQLNLVLHNIDESTLNNAQARKQLKT